MASATDLLDRAHQATVLVPLDSVVPPLVSEEPLALVELDMATLDMVLPDTVSVLPPLRLLLPKLPHLKRLMTSVSSKDSEDFTDSVVVLVKDSVSTESKSLTAVDQETNTA